MAIVATLSHDLPPRSSIIRCWKGGQIVTFGTPGGRQSWYASAASWSRNTARLRYAIRERLSIVTAWALIHIQYLTS